MAITVLKAVSIIIVLVLMVLILVSVNHLMSGNFDSEPSDIKRMREDLKEDEHVITDESVFNDLVKVRNVHRVTSPEHK